MKNLIPINGYLLVEPISESNATETGIVVVSNKKFNPPMGKIVKAAPGFGWMNEGTYEEYQPGDVIVYPEGVSTNFVMKYSEVDKPLHLLEARFVLGVIRD